MNLGMSTMKLLVIIGIALMVILTIAIVLFTMPYLMQWIEPTKHVEMPTIMNGKPQPKIHTIITTPPPVMTSTSHPYNDTQIKSYRCPDNFTLRNFTQSDNSTSFYCQNGGTVILTHVCDFVIGNVGVNCHANFKMMPLKQNQSIFQKAIAK